MSEPLLTTNDVAKMLGVKPRTVQLIVGLERVEIPAGGKRPILRFTPESVQKLIAERTRRAGV